MTRQQPPPGPEIKAGQCWQFVPRDKSPWPVIFSAGRRFVTILDARDGWVRYYMSEFFPDERMKEEYFRDCYQLHE